jgi:MFS family permease
MTTQKIPKILTRDFILCCFAYFAFSSVFTILIPTLPIYLSRSGSNEAEIGILIGSFAISSLVLRPFIGKALLKIPEKTFMTAGTLLYAFTSVGYLLISPFWPFLIVRILQGIGFAFFTTASITLVANISSGAHRGQSFSYFYLAYNVSNALAPPLGMFLINKFGFTFLFLVCIGLSLCSLFITNRLGRRQVTLLEKSLVEDGFLLSRKALPPSIIGFFSFSIWGALATFFPIYALNHGVANPGLFFTIYAIMMILCRVLGGKILDLYSKERIIFLCITPYIISMAILAFSKTLPMFILVAMIYGIGPAFLTPTLAAYALDRGGSPGPVMGTFQAITDLGMTLGPVIMGIVIHVTSYPIMFLCLALFGIVDLNYFYFFVRKKKGDPLIMHISVRNR